MSETRSTIEDYIRSNPGVYFNQIVRSLDLAPGQVQYHLRRLEEGKDIVEQSLYGHTHYYPETYDDWERNALALFRRETSREILLHLIDENGAKPSEMTDELGIARSTLEWHLDHLIEQEIVEKERDMGGRVNVVLTQPEKTRDLLEIVSPSLPDKLIDRFIRLFDQL
ncbi:winged helix-turn-helix transcriptional regulator [Halorutilales archaeon Cl-col2-1]